MKYSDKLKRDYQKDPLKYGECPLYEDLYFLYVDCNLTYEEVGEYFNNMKPCSVKARIKKLGIEKPLKLKVECIKRKTFEKYGETSYSRLQEYKDRTRQTCLEKYGVTNANKTKEVRDKIKQTNLKKYGTEVASKNDQVKEKTKSTCLKKYGVDAYTQTDEFKEKSKQTNLKRYNVEFASQSEQFQNQVKKTNMEKYNVPYALMSNEIIQKGKQTCLEKWGTSNISTKHIDPKVLEIINDKDKLFEYINKFEIKDTYEIAKTLGITYDGLKKKLQALNLWDTFPHKITHAETELKQLFPDFEKTKQVIPPYEIDLYNNTHKLGIEYNGLYWHSELFKDKYYHRDKSKLAAKKDVFLYHIYEHEWINNRQKPIIISQLNNLIGKNTQKIGARKCIIQEIKAKDSNNFLEINHLQGKDNASICIGLFYKNELVSLMTFCKPRFTDKYEWELSRFCNKLNTSVCGGASKLFNYFLKTYQPNSIISYSNSNKTKGNIYRILGFEFKDQTPPNYIWFKGLKVLSRYQCQKHKLTEYFDLGNTEDEIMHNRGFLKLYDCGNLSWIWHK